MVHYQVLLFGNTEGDKAPCMSLSFCVARLTGRRTLVQALLILSYPILSLSNIRALLNNIAPTVTCSLFSQALAVISIQNSSPFSNQQTLQNPGNVAKLELHNPTRSSYMQYWSAFQSSNLIGWVKVY